MDDLAVAGRRDAAGRRCRFEQRDVAPGKRQRPRHREADHAAADDDRVETDRFVHAPERPVRGAGTAAGSRPESRFMPETCG